MKVVIDTNVLFSALLSSESGLRDILLEKDWDFYAPNYLFVELFRYKDKISFAEIVQKYGKLSELELYDYFQSITANIQFVKPDVVSVENRQRAYDLCKKVDEKDAVFVALCLELDAVLWTGDKKLKTHLIQNGFAKILEY